MNNNMFPSIKVIFKRGRKSSKGPIVQTVVHIFQGGGWKKVKPELDCKKHNVNNQDEDIFDMFSGKYIIIPKEKKNGICYLKNPYRLKLIMESITEKELKALKLKI